MGVGVLGVHFVLVIYLPGSIPSAPGKTCTPKGVVIAESDLAAEESFVTS